MADQLREAHVAVLTGGVDNHGIACGGVSSAAQRHERLADSLRCSERCCAPCRPQQQVADGKRKAVWSTTTPEPLQLRPSV